MKKTFIVFCSLVAVAILFFTLNEQGVLKSFRQITPETIDVKSTPKTELHSAPAVEADLSVNRIHHSNAPPFELGIGINPNATSFPDSMPESSSVCTAIVMAAEGPRRIVPNSIGLFPEVVVAPSSTTRVELATDPAETLIAQVVDGGHLNDLQQVVHLQANQSGTAAFEFSSLKSPGTYRIAVDVKGSRQFLCLTVK